MSSDEANQKYYPDVDGKPHFPAIEQEVLKHWQEGRAFEQSVEDRPHGEDGKERVRVSTTAHPSLTACRTMAIS